MAVVGVPAIELIIMPIMSAPNVMSSIVMKYSAIAGMIMPSLLKSIKATHTAVIITDCIKQMINCQSTFAVT